MVNNKAQNMKVPNVRVTVNHGEYKGIGGKVVGYDRDKYYRVSLDNGIDYNFKGYYLYGIEKLYGNHGRYFLQYNDCDVPLNHKELTLDKNFHTGKGKGFNNKRFRVFTIYIKDANGKEDEYSNLYFSEVKSKVRYAMQNGYSFQIEISVYNKNSSSFNELISFDSENQIIYTTSYGRSYKKYYGTFERSLIKLINKY